MEATVQGVFIAAYFLAPGLVHYYITRAFGLGSDSDPRDTELLLQSLTFTLALVAIEAGGLATSASIWDELREQLETLVSSGLASYADQHPFRLYASGSAALCFNLFLAGALGFFNIPGRFVEHQLQKGGLSERPVWHAVLSGSGRAKATVPNLKRAVRVQMSIIHNSAMKGLCYA